ncbi:hypothetical protein BDR06DRAFT_977793 [Suillus hirtellus]|nr:hypothetical protein BDR06DRAFT_977793 [Suillus hirtellus]
MAPPVTKRKHNFFVQGTVTKQKASTSESKDNDISKVIFWNAKPLSKTRLDAGKAPLKKKTKPTQAKLKKVIVKDNDDIPTHDAIFVKRKPIVGPSNQPSIVQGYLLSKADPSSESDAKDAVSPKETSFACIFSVPCECCIKDYVACTTILAKKFSEVTTCKAKVAAAADKKAKKAKKAKKKTNTPAPLPKSIN